VGPKSEAFGNARTEPLNEHVSVLDEVEEHCDSLRRFQIQTERAAPTIQ